MDDTTGPAGPAPPAIIYGGALGELDQIDRARGLTREQRVLVGVQNPITCSTPVRFYQERSNSLTSPHLTSPHRGAESPVAGDGCSCRGAQ